MSAVVVDLTSLSREGNDMKIKLSPRDAKTMIRTWPSL